MTKTLLAAVLAGTLGLSASLSAKAAAYQTLDAANSQIAFEYSQMGVKLDGQFNRFDGELNFDPAALDQSKVVLKVALDSVDTGSPEADDELQDVRWFDIDAHPQAVFTSSAIREVGPQQYEVAGTLQIKGRKQPVQIRATLQPQGDSAVFTGSFEIKRGDFAIGEGSWSSYDVVANEITVNFRMTTR
ncbi:YceI family protein [Alcaligenes sp. WGS1538]|uniref:YceI family protein n=1 Tax=Alcaligenes sp. WGS1538 TaxID=3366811 RepID=UPI00372D72DD